MANYRDPEKDTRARKYGFATEDEAWGFVERQANARDALGRQAAVLPADVLRDVANARKLLHMAGWDPDKPGVLSGIVESAIAQNPTGSNELFADTANKWLELKLTKVEKPTYKSDLRSCTRAAIKHLGKSQTSKITRVDVEAFLGHFTGYRKRNVFRKLTQIFDHAVALKLRGDRPSDHPCWKIGMPKLAAPLPTPVSIDSARKILSLAIATEAQLGCTGWIIWRMFRGLRDSESSRIRYHENDGINLDGGFAHLNRLVAKSNDRTIFVLPKDCPDRDLADVLPPNLGQLLADLAQRFPVHVQFGRKLNGSRKARDEFKKLVKALGIEWGKNALRAGFASYHSFLFNRPHLTAAIMGHSEGLEVFKRHYRRFATYIKAKTYFELGTGDSNWSVLEEEGRLLLDRHRQECKPAA